jgi:hypothetical protein
MLLVNVYNSKDTTTINDLAEFLPRYLQRHKYGKIAIVGDFNLHHPLWNAYDYNCYDSKAEDLIDFMATNRLDLILPLGQSLSQGTKQLSTSYGETHRWKEVC